MTGATIPWLDDKAPTPIDRVRFCRVCHKKLSRYNQGKVCYGCSSSMVDIKRDGVLISMYDKKAMAALNAKLAVKPKKQIVKKIVFTPQPKTCVPARMSDRQIEGLQILAVSDERMTAKELGQYLGLGRANDGNVVLHSFRNRGFAKRFWTTPMTWEITDLGREWLSDFYKMSQGDGE